MITKEKLLKRTVLYVVLFPAALLIEAIDLLVVTPMSKVFKWVDNKFIEISEWAQD